MNLVLNSERPLTNQLSHGMAVLLFLKDNVKPKMYDIKWNAECRIGPILQIYCTILTYPMEQSPS